MSLPADTLAAWRLMSRDLANPFLSPDGQQKACDTCALADPTSRPHTIIQSSLYVFPVKTCPGPSPSLSQRVGVLGTIILSSLVWNLGPTFSMEVKNRQVNNTVDCISQDAAPDQSCWQTLNVSSRLSD